MKIKHYLTLSLPALGVVLLAACGQETGESQNTTVEAEGLAPHETVEQSVAALKNNDLETLLKLTLPQDKYAEVRAQWEAKKREPIDEEEKQEYAQMMQTLTQDGAEDKIMAQLEPQLEQMRAQIPMFIGMFQGIAQSSITQSEDMSDQQKQQAQKAVTAVAAWAQKTDLASPELAREAVGIAVDTAKEVNLPTLEDVRALSFEQMLDKGGVVLAGIKDILAVYNLNVDETLDSVQAETVSRDGDTATVRTTFNFLDTEQVYEGEYVKVDDRWVAREAMETDIEKIAEEDTGASGG